MSNRIDPRTTDALGRDTAGVPIALSNNQSKVVELVHWGGDSRNGGISHCETERRITAETRCDAIRKRRRRHSQWRGRPSRHRRPRHCDVVGSMQTTIREGDIARKTRADSRYDAMGNAIRNIYKPQPTDFDETQYLCGGNVNKSNVFFSFRFHSMSYIYICRRKWKKNLCSTKKVTETQK